MTRQQEDFKKNCKHKDISVNGKTATCGDCGRTFVGW